MPSILFVCTGNIFRSLTAEYALKARLDPNSPIRVSSAGTVALLQQMHPDVRAYLEQRGVDPSLHQQRRVSAELLRASDLIIAMSMDHQAILVDTFQYSRHYFLMKSAMKNQTRCWRCGRQLPPGKRCPL
jgi:protein-tyrosine-phosphatase